MKLPPALLSLLLLIVATGLENVGATGDRLVRALLARGLARLDRHGFGLDVSDELALIGADGATRPGLWALGPLVRGVFWECIAVPDVRVQAAFLAQRVLANTGNPAFGLAPEYHI